MLSTEQINYYRRIITAPVISEKAMESGEELGKYHFRVPRHANKIEIRNAIEAIFGVRVRAVNTMNVKGKHRRQNIKHRMGKTADWKKAIVQLAPGDRIDVMQSS